MNDTASTTHPIALITGGSRGLGRSMALHLAGRGSDVVITYRSNEAEARKVAEQVAARGRKALTLPLDVGDGASFAAFADTLRAHAGAHLRPRPLRPPGQQRRRRRLRALRRHHRGPVRRADARAPQGALLPHAAPAPLMRDGGRILNISTGLARFSCRATRPTRR
jgi:NAD(P)-dependent dehydrogenase (short-subunit alcohol dehydrogenase family)